MKKISRYFAGMTMLASVLSLNAFPAAFSCPVYAESIITAVPASGTLTITKRDTSTEHKPITGTVYTAYKIMSLTPGTIPGEFASYAIINTYQEVLKGITADNLNNYSASQIEKLVKELEETIRLNEIPGTVVSEATDSDGKTILNDLDLGWYLIVETTAPAGTVAGAPFLISVPSTNNITAPGATPIPGTSWIYALEAAPKSPKITVSKDIINGQGAKDSDFVTNSTSYIGKKDTAAEGDFVNYQITASVPAYGDSFFYNNGKPDFKFSDTMSPGLTAVIDQDHPLKIMIGKEEIPETVDTRQNYVVTLSPSDDPKVPDITIEFKNDFLQNTSYQGQDVTISYFAQVNEKAVMGTAGNTNNVIMSYHDKPNSSVSVSPEPDGDEPVPDNYVYTYGICVDKFSEDAVPVALEGAKFKLYKDAALTDALKVPEKTDTEGAVVDMELTTDPQGSLIFPRLDAGTYYLKETQSPAGYSLLANPIKIEIIPSTDSATGKIINGNFTLKVNGADVSASEDTHVTNLSVSDGTAVIAVQNHKGFSLPATGGPGVFLFLIISIVGILTLSLFMLKPQKKSE